MIDGVIPGRCEASNYGVHLNLEVPGSLLRIAPE
jgi:hypothetical protein